MKSSLFVCLKRIWSVHPLQKQMFENILHVCLVNLILMIDTVIGQSTWMYWCGFCTHAEFGSSFSYGSLELFAVLFFPIDLETIHYRCIVNKALFAYFIHCDKYNWLVLFLITAKYWEPVTIHGKITNFVHLLTYVNTSRDIVLKMEVIQDGCKLTYKTEIVSFLFE